MRELRIQAVGAQGDGIAEGSFVPLTLPGERVTAEMNGNRGELVEVLEPSSDRVLPPCPHFGVCGGCAFQHWDAAPYLEWKREQVRFQLAREGLETEVLPTFASPPASRRRVALHARGGKGGARLGFK
ncbi:MAG: RNA methyltransferase, partial [Caulobacter sp.]|nr:RNA methyltransferase [Caulobacter sp.]